MATWTPSSLSSPSSPSSWRRRRGRPPGGEVPPPPKRKWQAIVLATLVLVPAYWLMLVGLVDVAVDDRAEGLGNPAAGLAAGLAIIPFVFIILAFVSEHPRAPGAVVRAMLVSLAVGLVVSGLVGDAVSGLVAGVGAGGACALRPEPGHSWRGRAVAVLVATIYTAVLVRTIGAFVLVPAPVFPLTAVGLADHAVARRDLHAAAR